MPVVACPKCPAQLKIADGASGHVKCPKCGTLFPVTAPKPAAFEVVDGTPASAPVPKPATAPPQRAPAPADEDDFEVVPEKPKKKSRDRYDDDEEDDEDDRPRSRRKRRRDYDDEDDDDRPRRRRKRRRDYDDYDDDDEDDWPEPKRKKSTGFGPARTGALLLGIGAWLYMGTFGLMALLVLIAWAGGGMPSGVMVIAGLVGLGNWIVSLVGLGFCLAGPPRTRGTALAATIVSAVHLILSFVCFINLDDGLRGFGGLGFGSSSAWVALASVLPAVDMALPLLIYQSGAFSGGFLVAFLAGGCEIARLILIIFTLKGQALAARDYGTAERSKSAVMAVAGVCGGVALAALLIAVLVVEGQLFRAGMHLASAAMLLSYLAYAFMTMAPALLARDVKDTLPNRA